MQVEAAAHRSLLNSRYPPARAVDVSLVKHRAVRKFRLGEAALRYLGVEEVIPGWSASKVLGVNPGRAARAGLFAGAVGTGLAAAAMGAAWHWLARRPLPKEKGTIMVAGLGGAGRVRGGGWGGVPM